jgi:hypothetical protein
MPPTTTAPPATTSAPLPPDLVEALRRLKLATVRRLAPEVLHTAKVQRWTPEEVLRTLVEAEVAACDESNLRNRLRRRLPRHQNPRRVQGRRLIGTPSHLRLPGRAAGYPRPRISAWSGPTAPAKATCSWPSATPPSKPGTRCATCPPPTSSNSSTRGLADNSVGHLIDTLLRHDLVIIDLCRTWNYADPAPRAGRRCLLRWAPGGRDLSKARHSSTTGVPRVVAVCF